MYFLQRERVPGYLSSIANGTNSKFSRISAGRLFDFLAAMGVAYSSGVLIQMGWSLDFSERQSNSRKDKK